MLRFLCSAALLLALAAPTSGQTRPRPPVTPPGASPSGSSENPLGAPPPAAPNMVTLQYPNSDVADVLHLYEQLTDKKLVFDNAVQGKVNIFIAKPMPRDEAVKIIEMNLLLNGYSLVPAEGDIVKVIGVGKNPRTTGVPIISDDADIPAGDHVISFVFKLRYADPIELQQILGQYLSPPQSYTSFLALPKSSSIVVTENSSVIRSLVRIINQVDIPPAEVVSEFIKLERADATKVVDMLKEVFEKGTQQPGQAPPGVNRGVRPVAVPPPQQNLQVEGDVGALTALSEDSVVVGKIKMAADVRTNRIHVITRPINMPFIRKLIAEFDANVDFAKPVTRALKFISAADVLPVLVQALTEPGMNQQGGEAGAAGNPQQQQNPNAQRRTTSGVTSSNTSSSTATDSSLNVSEELSTTAVDTTPKAVTIGNAKIIADQRANAIIVLGNREVVVKVEKILDQMDVRAPQVALSTVIGELTLNNTEEFGVDWFQQFRHIPHGSNEGGVGGVMRNVPNTSILDPASLINFQQLAAAAAGGGANVFLTTGNQLSAIVHLLESTGRFKTIQRPTVFTSNNKKAIIASGTEVPVPVNTISSSTGGGIINTGLSQQSNIQFKKVALQLEVVPLINSEREVSLDILQKLDSLGQTARIDNNDIPTIDTRYIRTNVSVPNRSTVILGGLITDDKRKNATGLPILSRIPVIGGLFGNNRRTKDRKELIILMCPDVTLTKLELARLRKEHEDRSHFGPELDQDLCPDCPPAAGEDKQLPPPDLPMSK